MISSRKTLLFIIDSLLLAFSYAVFFVVSTVSSEVAFEANFLNYFLNFVLFYFCIFSARLALRVYSNVWRYANAKVYLLLVSADFVGALVAFFITRIFFMNTVYISVFHSVLNISVFTLLTILSRLCYQVYHNLRNPSKDVNKINVAIVGAGKTGSLLADELLHNSNSHYKPIFFVDVDKNIVGGYISGIKVIHEDKDVLKQFTKHEIKEIFIALPSFSSDELQSLLDFYMPTGCKIKLYDFAMNEESSVISDKRKLREVKIEDLLFRNTLNINSNETFKYYNGKTVLVTGGGGSIGSEICRQLAKAEPKQLVIFDIYENNVYDIQQELLHIYGDKLNLCVEIGSVRDVDRLDRLFNKYRPEVVFHAAAHKHVPLMENSCADAIKNNVLGTYNTANAAEKYNVQKFILISTDKAVNPTNVMGATKRMCEMVVQCRHDSKTTSFAAVRFGNVLGSNGSVIPLFRRQIEAGGPVTITDKRIIRYFMTIPEASQLVMQAGAMAQSGELYVLDMGNPVKIYDLAVNMIKLAGFIPNKDIMITETGLRPGEKLYEELLIASEDKTKTENDLIFIETDKPFTRQEVEDKIDILKSAILVDNSTIKKALKQVVPTYKNPDDVNKNAENSKEMQACEV